MKFTALAIAAFAAVVVAQDDGGLDSLKSQYPQYFQGVTSLSVPSQYQTAAPQAPAPAPQQPAPAPAPAPQQPAPAPAPPAPAPQSQAPAPAPAPAKTTPAPAAPAPTKGGNNGGYQLPPNFSSLLNQPQASEAPKKGGYELPPNFSSLLTMKQDAAPAKATGYQLPPNFSSLIAKVPTDAPSEAHVTAAGDLPVVIPTPSPLAEGQNGDENFGELQSLFGSFSGNLDNIQL